MTDIYSLDHRTAAVMYFTYRDLGILSDGDLMKRMNISPATFYRAKRVLIDAGLLNIKRIIVSKTVERIVGVTQISTELSTQAA